MRQWVTVGEEAGVSVSIHSRRSKRGTALGALAVMLAAAVVALPTPTTAQQSGVVDDEARHIYMELMSPFCPGLSLAACQSSKAADLREEIRERLAAGESKTVIIDSIVERYGDAVLATPPNRGFGRFAWLAPIGVGLFGLFLVVILLRYFARARAHRSTEAPEIDPAIRARIEREVESGTDP
jgi:cytochrome c-type biogenesis protein CcmH